MTPVIIETPYAGDVDKNVRFARLCMRDSLDRGEAPMMSHLLYTQVLDDKVPKERMMGMEAGWVWIEAVFAIIVYTDLGISKGMQAGIDRAVAHGKPIIYRTLQRAVSSSHLMN